MSNRPTQNIKSHQEQGIVNFLGSSGHIRHDKSRCNSKDGLALFKPNAPTADVQFSRRLCKAVKRIPPWESFRKQFRKVLIEFIKSCLGVGSIAEKAVIFGFGQR